MKVLVTGVKGQLGYDVMNELALRNHEAVGVDIDEMDITNADSVNDVITATAPDVVIHCAAWTAVDLAEDAENIDKVRLVNATGTENIAKVCCSESTINKSITITPVTVTAKESSGLVVFNKIVAIAVTNATPIILKISINTPLI